MRVINHSKLNLQRGVGASHLSEDEIQNKYLVVTGRGEYREGNSKENIISDDMFHILIEILGETDLEKIIFIKRYFLKIITDILLDYGSQEYVRIDNGKIMAGNQQLSFSVSDVSTTSGLIHIGLNANPKITTQKNPATLKQVFAEEIKKCQSSTLADPFTQTLEDFEEMVLVALGDEISNIFKDTAKGEHLP